MAKRLHPEFDGTKFGPRIVAAGAGVMAFGALVMPAEPRVGLATAAIGFCVLIAGGYLWTKGREVVVKILRFDGEKIRGTVSGPRLTSTLSLQVQARTVKAKVQAAVVSEIVYDSRPRLAEVGRIEETLSTDQVRINSPSSEGVPFQLTVAAVRDDPLASDYVELLVTLDRTGEEPWARTYRVPQALKD